MNESTTTNVGASAYPSPDRADLLARADAAFGDQIEAFARNEGVSRPAARTIRRNKVQQIGDAVIGAKQIHAALAAYDKG